MPMLLGKYGFANTEKADTRPLSEHAVSAILATEYDYICYIDLKQKEIHRYWVSREFLEEFSFFASKTSLSIEDAEHFFHHFIQADDQAEFYQCMEIKNAFRKLLSNPCIDHRFRANIQGKQVYYAVKVTPDPKDKHCYILSLRNIDHFVRKELAQVKDLELHREKLAILEEKAKLQKELQRERDDLQAFHDAMHSARWFMYFNGQDTPPTVEWGENLRHMLGYKDEHDFPNNTFEFFAHTHPDDQEIISAQFHAMLQSPKPEAQNDFKFRMRKKDGSYIWVHGIVRIHHDKEGNPLYANGFIVNINDAREKEKLYRKQQTYLDIFDALGREYSSIWQVNASRKNQLLIWDSGRYAMDRSVTDPVSDCPYKDGIENYISKFVIPEEQDKLRQLLTMENIQKEISENPVYTVNFQREYDGNVEYYQVLYARIGKDIKNPSFIMAFHNVDDVVRQQRDTAMQMQEKSDLIETQKFAIKEQKLLQNLLEDALKKAESASQAKTRFLNNMSHDIRTPMNAIIGFNGIAKKSIDDREKLLNCLNKIELSSKHLLTIINDILDMARIESGKVTIEENRISVKEETEKLFDIVRQSAIDKELTFVTDTSSVRHDSIYSDAPHVNRVLMNILNNAVKYTPSGGTIRVTITEHEPFDDMASYDFIVEDNGMGMSKEFQAHIFDAFSRESTSTISGIQGTGLGMAITKQLIDLMKGTIDIESELGIGTKVTIHLDQRIAEEIKAPLSESEQLASLESLHGKKVLLVEDNDLNREIAIDILEGFGLDVFEAEDGFVAVEKCHAMLKKDAEDYYDIILMDVQMPIMDGYTATKEIRQLFQKKDIYIPIVAMTANAFAEDRQKALEAGMDTHLAKPINVDLLQQVLISYIK